MSLRTESTNQVAGLVEAHGCITGFGGWPVVKP